MPSGADEEQLDLLTALGVTVPAQPSPPQGSADVRSSDPETSRLAAAAVDKTPVRFDLLRAFGAIGGLTDFELADKTGWNKGTASKRRYRAQQAGLVEVWVSGGGVLTRSAPETGAPAQVFRLTARGAELLTAWEAEER